MKTKISCRELLDFVPDEILEELEGKTKVNHQTKKLTGKIMFKLLLFSLANSNKLSQRVIEEFYNSEKFSLLANKEFINKTKHTSISDRLINIDHQFFKDIFEYITVSFQEQFNLKEKDYETSGKFDLIKFDSTLVGLSAKLLKTGMKIGNGNNRQIKFTVGMKNDLPISGMVFNKQKEINENIALKEAILRTSFSKDSILLFDRGLQKRKTFEKFTTDGTLFVTRAIENVNYKFIKTVKQIKGKETETLVLEKDIIVKLKDENCKLTKKNFRLIVGISKKTKKKILFLTNIIDLDTKEITELYKRRWEIETFFRFLKQELNFSHLISRTENGSRVMMYMTLILSSILIVYKRVNQITGYKIAKLRFSLELEMEIIRDIAEFHGSVSNSNSLKSRCFW